MCLTTWTSIEHDEGFLGCHFTQRWKLTFWNRLPTHERHSTVALIAFVHSTSILRDRPRHLILTCLENTLLEKHRICWGSETDDRFLFSVIWNDADIVLAVFCPSLSVYWLLALKLNSNHIHHFFCLALVKIGIGKFHTSVVWRPFQLVWQIWDIA